MWDKLKYNLAFPEAKRLNELRRPILDMATMDIATDQSPFQATALSQFGELRTRATVLGQGPVWKQDRKVDKWQSGERRITEGLVDPGINILVLYTLKT